MICKNCGTVNPDEATVCATCGEELEVNAQEEEQLGLVARLKSYLTKKNLIIAGAGALALVILIFVLSWAFSNPAEDAVEDLYEAVLDYDYEAVVEMMPPALVDHLKSELALEESEIEIVDSQELNSSFVADIDDEYRKYFDTNKGYIQEATVVYLDIKWKGEALTRERVSVYMVKISGEWYFDPVTTFDDVSWDLFG